jgi:hypothetical protein
MIIAMLALVALIGIGGLSVLTVQGGLTGGTHQRFKSMALYAAESGAAVAMDYLRARYDQSTGWSNFVNQNNNPPFPPSDLPGNGVRPGQLGYLFGPDARVWYEVTILNNEDDSGFNLSDDQDTDGRVIIAVTGFAPNNVAAQIHWEVKFEGPVGLGQMCGGYGGQAGGGAEGSGNDCGTPIDVSGGTGSNNLGNP